MGDTSQGRSTSHLEEMRAYVELTKADEELLRDFWPTLEDRAPAIIDVFYERIMQFEGAAAVLKDEAQTIRLRKTLQQWLQEVFLGPHDEDYARRRRHIGEVHVRVGLESRYMHLAMSVVLTELQHIVCHALPPERCPKLLQAIQRVTMMDLALMNGTYVINREKRQLHALRRMLIDHLRVTVILVGTDGHVLAGTVDDNDTTTPWRSVVPTALLAPAVRCVHAALSSNEAVTIARVDDAHRRSFRLHAVPLGGDVATFLLQIEELTDVVSLEARLHRAEALAQLGTLSAAVAHELRNPLAGISGALQILESSLNVEEPLRDIMGKVQGEVKRLDTLVTDLLAFARPGPATCGPVSLANVATATVELMNGRFDRVEVRGSGTAIADADKLRQVLLNLLQNAIQAGATRLLIAIEDGCISVEDDGPGIPEEVADELFEPFVTSRTRGTGLGLAICRQAMEAMDGTIDVRKGKLLGGAAFDLELLNRS